MKKVFYFLFFIDFAFADINIRPILNYNAIDGYKKILTDNDILLYHKIFDLQNKHKFKEADRNISLLKDDLLLGYVYYQRYMSNSYRAYSKDLIKWLKKYSDLPFASDIRALALRKTYRKKWNLVPYSTYSSNILPIYKQAGFENKFHDIREEVDKTQVFSVSLEYTKLEKKIRFYLNKGKTKNVRNLLSKKKNQNYIGESRFAYYSSSLAKMYFLDGQDENALKWAKKAIKITKNTYYKPLFIAGLVYWRNKDYERAVYYFKQIADNPNLYPTNISQGAYWTARSYLKLNDIQSYVKYLEIGSKYHYSFYGILSAREIDADFSQEWKSFKIDNNYIKVLTKSKEGRRALALLELGYTGYSEKELLGLIARVTKEGSDSKDQKAILYASLLAAEKVPFPHLGYKLAGKEGIYRGLSSYSFPIYLWGYEEFAEIDPTLLLALVRRESNFNVSAKSYVGASGLMQLMPSTAHFLSYKYNGKNVRLLNNPEENIRLGERYIRYLLENPNSRENIIYVLAGWNGGFLNLTKWTRQKHRMKDDPLFFIESIPFNETRNFIKYVLTDYWIYRLRFGLKPYTLDEIIRGEQPIYRDNKSHEYSKITGYF